MKTDAFTFPYLKYLFIAWLIIAFLSSIYFVFFRGNKNALINIFISFGLISTGYATGVIMGNNRNPISDTIMSSVIALLSGVITFIFLKKEDLGENSQRSELKALNVNQENKIVISIFLILFPMSILYGAHVGSIFRIANEEYNRNVEYNNKLRLDSVEIWKKEEESRIQIDQFKTQNYYLKMYETWSENERTRYKNNKSKTQDTLPDVPVYFEEKE